MLKPIFAATFLCLSAPVWAQNPVTVHVVDEANAPVAGALVEVFVWRDEKGEVLAEFTNPQGAATFSLPKKPDEKLPAGRLSLHARGFAPAGARINRDNLEFRLQKGTTWRGKIVDEAGKPIEGAKVVATYVWAKGDTPAKYIALDGEKMRPIYEVSSKADGTFEIGDLPVGGKLSFGVHHPRFAANGGYDAPIADEKTITLLPGASLRGQVLDDKGAPLPKTRVFAQGVGQNQGYGEAQSDDQGRFQIDSLSSGNYNIMAERPDEAKFVVPAAAGVAAEAGKTLDVTPLRAVSGTIVRGLVRDATTKLPVAGARIGVYGPEHPETGAAMRPSPLTKADGRFEVRVAPGQNKFYFYQTPEGYLRGNGDEKRVEIGPAAPADLVFDLKPKTLVSGVIVDENNRPIKAQLKTWSNEVIQSDANGKWQWSPDSEGPFLISGGEDESGYFELNEYLKIRLPVAAPLVVRVRKKPWQSLAGRVVTADGQPIEGTSVKGRFFVPIDEEGALSDSNREATSDAQGRFVLPKLRVLSEGRELQISAEKAGFAFQAGGEVSKVGEKLSVSDFVFVPLSGVIEGTTSPGARVVAAGREVLVDADGKFKFEGLPAGETVVFAAKAGQFGRAVAAPNTPLQIGLQTQKTQGVDVEMGRQIWRDVIGDAATKDYYAAAWLRWQLSAPQGDDVESLKRAALEPATPNHDRQLAMLIQKLAPRLQKDGQLSVMDAALRAIATPEIRLTALLDAAIATSDKALARRALDESAIVLATPSPDLMWREGNLYRIAIATEKLLGEAAGLKALNQAINWTLANRPAKPFWKDGYLAEPGRDQWLQGEAETVALGSIALLKRLLSIINPEGGTNVLALSEAIPVVAQTHGIEAALPLLEELRLLPKPTDKEHSAPLNNEPEWAFGQAARRVIPLLGEKSPQRALELARRVTTKNHQVRALASAAKFQTGALAADLWREVVQSADAGDAARFAASAWEFDPKLGAGLFEIARQKAAQGNQPWMRGGAWPTFAFYFARVDAAQSRLILEREWAKAQQNKGEGAQSVAMAMSTIDANRADEMARQIADKATTSPETRRKIGQYLQTSLELRRDFPFDRWNAGDTWEAGDPEW